MKYGVVVETLEKNIVIEKKLFKILTCLNKRCDFPKYMWTNKIKGTKKDKKNLARVHTILYKRYGWF